MSGQYLNCESKKTFIKVFLFDTFMHALILASTLFFCKCLHKSDIYDQPGQPLFKMDS